MKVFELGLPLELTRVDLAPDLIQPGHNGFHICCAEYTDPAKHARVRLTCGNVLTIEARIKTDRLAESFHDVGG